MYIFAESIYWGSLVFTLLAPFAIFGLYKKSPRAAYLAILFFLVFLWARFIEPQWIRVKEIDLQKELGVKIALISDTHMGVYKNPSFLKRAVSKINAFEPDVVLIAGDSLYFSKDPEKDLGALSGLNAPTFAVLGNHDVEQSGKYIKDKTKDALEKAGVKILENEVVDLEKFQLFGLGELWEEKSDLEILQKRSADKQSIVLIHNPDAVLNFTGSDKFKNLLVLAGHTHCGQIRIPILYRFVIPTKGNFPRGGVYKLPQNSKLIVSCGLGEIGLPARLFNPPEIILINL